MELSQEGIGTHCDSRDTVDTIVRIRGIESSFDFVTV